MKALDVKAQPYRIVLRRSRKLAALLSASFQWYPAKAVTLLLADAIKILSRAYENLPVGNGR